MSYQPWWHCPRCGLKHKVFPRRCLIARYREHLQVIHPGLGLDPMVIDVAWKRMRVYAARTQGTAFNPDVWSELPR